MELFTRSLCLSSPHIWEEDGQARNVVPEASWVRAVLVLWDILWTACGLVSGGILTAWVTGCVLAPFSGPRFPPW